MYRGKHALSVGKGIGILASVVLLAGIAIGGTLAYLTDSDAPVENTFLPAKVTTSVVETLEDGVKSQVKIQNTGDISAYIRSAVAVSWQDDGGHILGKAPEAGADYAITWVLSGWEQGADGFYYFLRPVAPGDCTDVLFTDCRPIPGKTPEGYHLAVEVLGSGIQSLPAQVVAEMWSSGVSGVEDDGLLVVKGGQGA